MVPKLPLSTAGQWSTSDVTLGLEMSECGLTNPQKLMSLVRLWSPDDGWNEHFPWSAVVNVLAGLKGEEH